MRALIVSYSTQGPIASKLHNGLRPLVDDLSPMPATFETAHKAFSTIQPDLVFVVLSPHPEQGLETLQHLRQEVTVPLLAVGPATEPRLILRALQHGANHYLDQAELEDQLEGALARWFYKQDGGCPPGRLLGVLGASGGCGTSTIAVNVAVALATQRHSCCLIDLNLGHGDAPTLLDVKPSFTVAELCQNEARLDKAMFEKMLVRHPSGVSLLASPPMFEHARSVTPRGVLQALSLARKSFPEVVVDLEDCFHDEQVATLQQATGILLLCRLDFTSVRNARRMLDQLNGLDVPRHRIKLVINQSGQPGELPQHEAEQALREKLTWFIPFDPKTINAANNTGIPAVVKEPHAKVSQSLIQLGQVTFDDEPAPDVTSPVAARVPPALGRIANPPYNRAAAGLVATA